MNARAQSQTQSSSAPSFTPAPVNLVQRKCACGGSAGLSGECTECQKEKLVGENAPLVQPKLKISQPNDKYEQEADRVADEVMRMPEPKVQRQVGVEEKEDVETIQAKPIASKITPLVQRQIGSEEDEKKLPLKPRSDNETIPTQESSGIQKSNKEEAKDALKKTGEAFLKTEPGKEIVKKGKEIVSSLPGTVITGTAAVGAVSALIATNKELPIQAPAIPLDAIHPGLSMKITVEGSLRSPTKAMISFSGKFGIGNRRERIKPDKTKTEKLREENNRKRREDFEFRESLKTPEEKARDNQRLVDTVTSRLPIPSLKSQGEVPAAEKEKKEETPVQRKEANNTESQNFNSHHVQEAIQSTGNPLDSTTRNFMEQRFGYDFSQVRIHTDNYASASARSVNAVAYTTGQNIVFSDGQYSPQTGTGQKILAHELTHVVQQSRYGSPKLVQRVTENKTGTSPLGIAPLDLKSITDSQLVCLIVCFLGIPPQTFKNIVANFVAAINEVVAISLSNALSKEEVQRFREEKKRIFQGASVISTLNLLMKFLVTGKILNIPVTKIPQVKKLRMQALRSAIKFTSAASLRTAAKYAARANLAVNLLFAAECLVACNDEGIKKAINDVLNLVVSDLASFAKEAEGIGFGLITAFEQEIIYRDIYEFTATIDPDNWDQSTILPEAEGATNTLEDVYIDLQETFDKLEDKPLEFKRLSRRPIRELGVDRSKIEQITALVNEFLEDDPENALFFVTEEELEANPKLFLNNMFDALLIDFVEDPEDIADRFIKESVEIT